MKQFNVLKKYQCDYNDKLSYYVKYGMTGVKWKHYIEFIRILDSAVEQQNKLIIEYDNRLKNFFSDWRRANSNFKGWECLEYKMLLRDLKRKTELEEINIDEFSKLKFFKNRGVKL
ncbi:flagellar FliJ family protein [Buchnera aphidicola]|uniref:flagellar FliJ family protein n=1 Tax=Buchnera aphidicola TaxID=9 RepID=UPI003463E914